jgi:hypothetical protein
VQGTAQHHPARKNEVNMPSKYGFETDDDRKEKDQAEQAMRQQEHERERESERNQKWEWEQEQLPLATRITPIIQDIIADYLANKYSVTPKVAQARVVSYESPRWLAGIEDKVVGHSTGTRDEGYGNGPQQVTWEIYESYELLVKLDFYPEALLKVSLQSYGKVGGGYGSNKVLEIPKVLLDVLHEKTGIPATSERFQHLFRFDLY